jgi:hypothetical protein
MVRGHGTRRHVDLYRRPIFLSAALVPAI